MREFESSQVSQPVRSLLIASPRSVVMPANSGLFAIRVVSTGGVIELTNYISRESLYVIIGKFPFSGVAKRRPKFECTGDRRGSGKKTPAKAHSSWFKGTPHPRKSCPSIRDICYSVWTKRAHRHRAAPIRCFHFGREMCGNLPGTGPSAAECLLLGVPISAGGRRSSVHPFSANERASRWRT
jgi:hypothetical protein